MYKIIGADDKEYGPISADQLRQWISEGRINGNSKVQADGSGVWKRASEFPEFAAALPVAVPVPSAAAPPVHAAPITMGPPPGPPKTNTISIWALVTGIISFLPCCWGIVGVVSIILGCIALSQLKRNPQQTGSGFAITGIVLGILSLILGIIGTIIFYSFPQIMQNFPNVNLH